MISLKEDSMFKLAYSIVAGSLSCAVVSMVGESAVAIEDGEFTVKSLANGTQSFCLTPGNSAFNDIRAKNKMNIFWLVRGYIRRY